MQTFLQAVNSAADMPVTWKEEWREKCRQHYLGKLLVWARAHPNPTADKSEQLMLHLCEGRAPETLEHWCMQLRCMEVKIDDRQQQANP